MTRRPCYCRDHQAKTTTPPAIVVRNRLLALRRAQQYQRMLWLVWLLWVYQRSQQIQRVSLAVTHVQTVHRTRVTVTTGTTTVTGTGVAAGNALVVVLAWFNGGAVAGMTISDDQGDTWALANQASGDTSSHVGIFAALNVDGGDTIVTIDPQDGGAGQDITIEGDLLEFAGVALTDALDAVVDNSGTSAQPDVASGTLANADSVIFGIASHTGNDTTWAVDSAGTLISENEDNDSGQTYSSQYQIVTVTTSELLEWTLGTTRQWFAALASFKGVAAGGGGEQALSVAMVSGPALTRLSTRLRTLAATEVASPTVTPLSTRLRTLAATMTASLALTAAAIFARTLAATEVASVALSTLSTRLVTLSATATGTGTLDRLLDLLRTLSATVVSVPTLATLATRLRTLSATMTASLTLAAVSLVTQALAVAMVAVTSLTTLSTRLQTLAATLTGTGTLSRLLTLSQALAATLTSVSTLSTLSTRLRSLAATLVSGPALSTLSTRLVSLAATALAALTLATQTIVGGLLTQTVAATAVVTATLSAGRFVQIINGTVRYLGETTTVVSRAATQTLGSLVAYFTTRRG